MSHKGTEDPPPDARPSLISGIPSKPNTDFSGQPPPPEVEQIRCCNPACGVFIGHNYTCEEMEPQQCSDCRRLDTKLAPLAEAVAVQKCFLRNILSITCHVDDRVQKIENRLTALHLLLAKQSIDAGTP